MSEREALERMAEEWHELAEEWRAVQAKVEHFFEPPKVAPLPEEPLPKCPVPGCVCNVADDYSMCGCGCNGHPAVAGAGLTREQRRTYWRALCRGMREQSKIEEIIEMLRGIVDPIAISGDAYHGGWRNGIRHALSIVREIGGKP
jgi:hypothetical protein